jgi:conjugation system TraG family ATPase
MQRNLSDILPIIGVEHDCILSRQGDITAVFEVQLPEIFTLSQEEFETVHQCFVKAIRVLPAQTVLHKQDWFTEASYDANFRDKAHSFLSRASEHFFHERPYLDHRCFILLTMKATSRKVSSSLFSSLLKKSIVPAETLKPHLLQEFLNYCGQFRKILDDCGYISLRQLTNDELSGTSRSTGIIEQYLTLQPDGCRTFIDDICFSDGIRVGHKHCQLFTLADAAGLPSLCSSGRSYDRYSTDKTTFTIGFTTPLAQLLPCNHIYNQYIFIDDAQSTLKKMEGKRLRLQSLAAYSRENMIVHDATNDFLNEAIARQRLPVKAHFNVLAWSHSTHEIKEVRNLVSSALARMNVVPKQELSGAPQIFWAGTPGNAADFPVNDCFDTFAEQACCFFNLESHYRSSVSPFGIRLGDRLTGRPLHVDISDEPMKRGLVTNRNKFILGPSGSGKSFFTNHMLRSYYEQGTHLVIVDVGHSYKGLCQLVGGYYFTYDDEHPIRFNPFYIPHDDILDTEKKESIKTLLLALWKKDNETFRRSEYVALSNALQLYYDKLAENESVFPCFNTFYEFLSKEFVQHLSDDQVKEKDFDISNFLYVLRPYYAGGEFDYLLNADRNLDLLSERFIVFELDNIKDHPILFPVVTIIIMEVFISKMRKLKGIRKMILIEEAWKAIAREGMAEYIKYLFKTVRKFFGEAVVVTQDIEDIISSPIIRQAIINNADCKILLDQSKYQNKFSQVQELLGLTDKEKALILSMNKANEPGRNYKEVFILGRVYRVEVSPEEYLAYTTEESDKIKVTNYAARFGSMQRGIAALAEELKT